MERLFGHTNSADLYPSTSRPIAHSLASGTGQEAVNWKENFLPDPGNAHPAEAHPLTHAKHLVVLKTGRVLRTRDQSRPHMSMAGMLA
jgi:hypothetical protein